MQNNIDCNDCKHVIPTENEQKMMRDKTPHMCELHGRAVLHSGKHPKLTPLKQCAGNDFELRGFEPSYIHVDESTKFTQEQENYLLNKHNALSIKIFLQNNKNALINDTKLLKVSETPDLVPFFTELMTFHTDYLTGQVLTLPTIYGSVKTKKCVRKLNELRIMRFSRKLNTYVIMDGVYKVVVWE